MKIVTNAQFNCYETCEESWIKGEDITLDGVKIIPITVLDKIRAEIEQLNYDIAFMYRTRDVAEIKHKIYLEDVFQIIDKYKAEREAE